MVRKTRRASVAGPVAGFLIALPGALNVVALAQPNEPGTGNAPAAVEQAESRFQRDEARARFRLVVEADDAELLSAVGMIHCSRVVDGRPAMSRGTATVVGSRNTVLTAAHNLAAPAERGRPAVEFEAGDCVFRQYDAGGEPVLDVAFTHATFGAYRNDPGRPNDDWVVLETVEPLPESTAALSYETVASSQLRAAKPLPIAVLAFHLDRERRGRWLRATEGTLFEVTYVGADRLAHTAATARMSSGAAIVHRAADGRRVVVALHRSSANLDDFNLAVPMSVELEAALARHASGTRP